MAKEVEYKPFTFRYQLEPYKGKDSRFTCPQCGKKNTFARYVDVTTGEYADDDCGRCNRVIHCGYLKYPTTDEKKTTVVKTKEVKPEYLHLVDRINFVNSKYVVESMRDYEDNNFVKFLFKYFNKEDVTKVINLYRVGTSDKWEGSTVFWQLDEEFNTRTGKIMLYNEVDGKRVKQPYNHITWFHTPDKCIYNDFNLEQCFFGQHLLQENNRTRQICVVESEKTAILGCLAQPDCIWIATGGIQNINEQRMEALRGREVVFYPDKGDAYYVWKDKIEPFLSLGNFKVSNYLNKKTELQEGDDIGDLIINKLL